jgi:CubicO group peptidase (beta-lactamase class C family)
MTGWSLLSEGRRRALRSLVPAHFALFRADPNGFEYSDLEGKALPDRHYYLASLAKAWTGLVARKCMSDWPGLLTAPLDEILPELPPGLTLTRLLTMDLGGSGKGAAQFGFGPHLTASQRLERWSARDEFGEGFIYHNGCYVAAALALERHFGEPFAQLVRTRICEAYSIGEPAFFPSAPSGARAPAYWRGNQRLAVPFLAHANSLGAGGLFANPATLGQWLQLSLAELPSPDSPGTVVTDTAWAERYGFGWFQGDVDGRKVACHSGSGPGYGLFALIFPEEQRAFAAYSEHHRSLAVAACTALAVEEGWLKQSHLDTALQTARRYCNVQPRSTKPFRLPSKATGAFLNEEAGLMTIESSETATRIAFADCPASNGLLAVDDAGTVHINFDNPAARHDPDPDERLTLDIGADCVRVDFYGDFRRVGDPGRAINSH